MQADWSRGSDGSGATMKIANPLSEDRTTAERHLRPSAALQRFIRAHGHAGPYKPATLDHLCSPLNGDRLGDLLAHRAERTAERGGSRGIVADFGRLADRRRPLRSSLSPLRPNTHHLASRTAFPASSTSNRVTSTSTWRSRATSRRCGNIRTSSVPRSSARFSPSTRANIPCRARPSCRSRPAPFDCRLPA